MGALANLTESSRRASYTLGGSKANMIWERDSNTILSHCCHLKASSSAKSISDGK